MLHRAEFGRDTRTPECSPVMRVTRHLADDFHRATRYQSGSDSTEMYFPGNAALSLPRKIRSRRPATTLRVRRLPHRWRPLIHPLRRSPEFVPAEFPYALGAI